MSGLKVFENRKIRTAWNADEEDWYFSIVDVCAVLTDSDDPRTYWKVLKHRLKAEGSELVTNCNQLKMPAEDGKMRLTDVANTRQLLRQKRAAQHRIRNRAAGRLVLEREGQGQVDRGVTQTAEERVTPLNKICRTPAVVTSPRGLDKSSLPAIE